MRVAEAKTTWGQDKGRLERYGIYLPDVTSYIPEGFRDDFGFAMDAQPTLATTPNSGIPTFLTTMIDPEVIKILFSPLEAADILGGERRKGSWTDQTAMFPVVENTGQVSSYGDFNNNGSTGANTNWPQFQSYLFQTMLNYGELEIERAGLAKINYVSELQESAALTLNTFQNLSYFRGIAGLQNYGLQNNPLLSAPLAPGPKANGNGNVWMFGTIINATANEVYADIQSLFTQLVIQSGGLVNQRTRMTLALSPVSAVALTATNSFNVNVNDLLKKNFPNLEIKDAVQYGVVSASNPQGITGGNLAQLIAHDVGGQETAYPAYNEKLRAHKIIPQPSAWEQKYTQGTWGTILRQPFCVAGMLGL